MVGTSALKVFVVHNRYIQPGGEDAVFAAEAALLEQRGCEVIRIEAQNTNPSGLIQKIGMAVDCTWSRSWHARFVALLAQHQPDVVHFHNTFPRISPSAYYACYDAGVPVVQTLHNYRLACTAASFYRDGKVCEECMEQGIWHGVKYGCYQGNKLGTAALALMIDFHRKRGTWDHKVDCYIALTDFARRKMIQAGLPAAKMVVKPNFVLPDPGPRPWNTPGDFALFVGRVVDLKGLPTLVNAWRQLPAPIPLVILGDGPYRPELEAAIRDFGLTSIDYRGRATRDEMFATMKQARFLVFPSTWYEGFPVTLAEAFACGVPVVTSRLGSMPEIVADGVTGWHFEAGNGADLAAKVQQAWANPEEAMIRGRAARIEFDAKYTADRNYDLLMEIYERVMQGHTLTSTPIRSAAFAGSLT